MGIQTFPYVALEGSGFTLNSPVLTGTPLLGTNDKTATPTGIALKGPDAVGTDIAGPTVTLQTGVGTGAGAVSRLSIETDTPGTTGAVAHTRVETARFWNKQLLLTDSGLRIARTSNADYGWFDRYQNDASASNLFFRKSRSTTINTYAIVNQDDEIGGLIFQGSDASGFRQAAAIRAAVDGAPGSNDMPGRLTLWTTPDGSAMPVERIRIDNAGRVGINRTPTAQFLEVGGNAYAAGTVYGDNATGFRNIVYNGAFTVNQRGSTSYASSTTNVYTVDRWFMRQYLPYTTGATLTRTTGAPSGFQYCVRLQRNSGQTWTKLNVLEQTLETVDSVPLQGQTITISAWLRMGADFSAASGVAYLGYRYGKGTDQSPSNADFTSGSGSQQAVTLTSSWQRFSFTVTVPSDATQLSFYTMYAPVGTASTNDYLEVAGFQVERGTVATPFEVRPYMTELTLCQRYYWQIGSKTGSVLLGRISNLAGSPAVLYHNVWYPVTMRTTPASWDAWVDVNDASPVQAGSITPSQHSLFVTHTVDAAGILDLDYVQVSAEL